MNGRSWLNKVPGFRSNVTWKKVVAIIGYVCIVLALFVPFNAETVGDYWVSFFERLIFIAVPFVLLLNVGNIRSKLPICKSSKAKISLAGAILFSAIWMIPAGIFASVAETYLYSPAFVASMQTQNQQQEKLQSESAVASSKLEQQRLAAEKQKQAESDAASSKEASEAAVASKAASDAAASQAAVEKAQSEAAASQAAVAKVASEQAASAAAAEQAAKTAAQSTSSPSLGTPASTSITIVADPGTVNAGQYATVKIKGSPNTQYTCTVTYKSSLSTAAGLGATQSDGNGYASWTWKVGARTTAGSWPVNISGAGGSASTHVIVQ